MTHRQISQPLRLTSCAISTSFPNANSEEPKGAHHLYAAVLGGAVLVVGLTALLYEAATRTFPGDSDGATVVLEGQAMSAGHLTLHGWALAADSFWTVDALFYTAGVGVLGIRPLLLQMVPALIAALVVVFGMLVACHNRRGSASIVAGLTVVALLAFPGRFLSYFFLRGPLHVGTALFCLAAFFFLRRSRFGPGWVIATVLLAAGILGDLQTVALGVVPVFATGLLSILRKRSLSAGVPTVGASVASVAVAVVVRKLADLVGTFSIGKLQPYASRAQMVRNLRDLPSGLVHMFGIESAPLSRGGIPSLLEGVHVLGLALVAMAVLFSLWRLAIGLARGDRARPIYSDIRKGSTSDTLLDDFLLTACAGSVVVFVALSETSAFEYDRYLTPLVVFGSVLTGRVTGHLAGSIGSRLVARIAAATGAVVVAAFALGTTLGITGSARSAPEFSSVVSFLEQRHLDLGIGDYLDASIITVTTAGRVTVRPVTGEPTGKVVRYGRQSDAAWYAGKEFQFLLYDTAKPGSFDSLTAAATFGPPADTYPLGSYRVLVWSHPLSVSTQGYDPG